MRVRSLREKRRRLGVDGSRMMRRKMVLRDELQDANMSATDERAICEVR